MVIFLYSVNTQSTANCRRLVKNKLQKSVNESNTNKKHVSTKCCCQMCTRPFECQTRSEPPRNAGGTVVAVDSMSSNDRPKGQPCMLGSVLVFFQTHNSVKDKVGVDCRGDKANIQPPTFDDVSLCQWRTLASTL